MIRKFINIALVAAAAIISLSASAAKPAPKASAAPADSLAYIIGRTQGAEVRTFTARNANTDDTTAYRAQFLDGFRSVLLSDTTQLGYLDGVAVGMQILKGVMDMEHAGMPVDRQQLCAAFADAFTGQTVPEEEVRTLTSQLNARMTAVSQARRQAAEAALAAEGEKNAAEGLAYVNALRVADNSIQTTADGLSYKVVKQGDGPRVQPGDKVKVIYTGRFTDGSEFDSSKGQPVTFNSSQLIPGFTEGLLLMPVGSTYIFYIPGDLAYGLNAPAQIGPNRTLVFEVELLGIEK